jgi:hypothetical protein
MLALTFPEHRARIVFCQWLLTTCFVNTQFVANILFTDEAGFTRDGIVNSHNMHVWIDESPFITMASKHQHRFSINVWVVILGVQFLPYLKRLTGAVYH